MTGARGFIGRQTLLPLLARGYDVHATTSQPLSSISTVSEGAIEGSLVSGVTWHTIDLLDVHATRTLLAHVRPDRLLHLAWTVEHGRFWTDARNHDWVAASLALAERFVECGGRHLVVAGTCAEYDWTALGDGVCHELTTPRRPGSVYGSAKLSLLERLEQDAIFRRLRFAWGRLFFLYGPGESPARLIPSVINALLRGEPARTSSGSQTRDFMDVRDAAAAFVALLSEDVEGAINVASGHPVQVADVVRRLGDLIGRADLIHLGALPERAGEPPRLVADVRRLKEDVRFQAVRSLDDGLADAISWWRAVSCKP